MPAVDRALHLYLNLHAQFCFKATNYYKDFYAVIDRTRT